MTIETEIAERLAQATKGPWRANNHKHVVADGEFGEIAICRVYDQPDELFIAHAPEDIATLLARVEELKVALRRYGRHSCCTTAIERRCTCGLGTLLAGTEGEE